MSEQLEEPIRRYIKRQLGISFTKKTCFGDGKYWEVQSDGEEIDENGKTVSIIEIKVKRVPRSESSEYFVNSELIPIFLQLAFYLRQKKLNIGYVGIYVWHRSEFVDEDGRLTKINLSSKLLPVDVYSEWITKDLPSPILDLYGKLFKYRIHNKWVNEKGNFFLFKVEIDMDVYVSILSAINVWIESNLFESPLSAPVYQRHSRKGRTTQRIYRDYESGGLDSFRVLMGGLFLFVLVIAIFLIAISR